MEGADVLEHRQLLPPSIHRKGVISELLHEGEGAIGADVRVVLHLGCSMNQIEIFPMRMTKGRLREVIDATANSRIDWLVEYHHEGVNVQRIFTQSDEGDMRLFYLGMAMGAQGHIYLCADDPSDLIHFRLSQGL